MVKVEDIEIWKCPYCKTTFEDDDDCEDHIKDHHMESPIEDYETKYICEICKDKFDKYSKALKCETKHEEGKDLKYQQYLHQIEMDKLIEAGNHPSQKKLNILLKR